MAIKQIQLIAPVQLTNAAAPYLTAPANTSYRVGRAGFANPTGGAVIVTAYLVASGGSPTVANEIVPGISVPAGANYISPEMAGLVVPQGSTIQALASAATSIVFYASGVSIQ